MLQLERPQASLESVFTKEYWGGTIPPMPSFKHSSVIGRMREHSKAVGFPYGRLPHETETSMREAVARNVSQLLRGVAPTPIAEGEYIGGADDTTYAIPGNILLFDTELLTKTRASRWPQKEEICSDFEIAASAVRLFKHTAKYETEATTAYYPGLGGITKTVLATCGLYPPTVEKIEPRMASRPYRGWTYNSEVGQIYRRRISLVAFAPNTEGRTTARGVSESLLFDDGEDITYLSAGYPHTIGRVGEARNDSVSARLQLISRTRAAYLCDRGAFEFATAPSRARHSRNARLVATLSQQPNA